MINIYPDNNKKAFLEKNTSNKKKINNTNQTLFPSFQETMANKIETYEWNQDIENCIVELDQLQDELVKNPKLEIIEKYRSIIGQLLQKLLNNYQSENYYRGIKNRIQLKTWSIINKELDSLAQEVIKNNIAGFQILSKINLIKGLIIDLKIGKS